VSKTDDTRSYGEPRREEIPRARGLEWSAERSAGESAGQSVAESVESLEALGRESLRLAEQADRLVRALAERAGLDSAALRCLHLLTRQGALPVHRLAALAGLERGAARAVVDGLERAGLVSRDRDGSGRTVVRADEDAFRARVDQALRELRESWYALTARRCDDLALVAALLAQGRRLTELVPTLA